ncbi:MAG: leucine-rich repeat protein [Clostridia bacterium]|nr:leucine-rich repeat protein [Clostridia bacterium]
MRSKITKVTAILLGVLMLICTLPISVSAASNSMVTYKKSNGEIIITGCKDKVKSIIIPEKIDGLPVTTIAEEAFKDGKFEYISIPDTIKKIGADAFKGCYTLKVVDIEDIASWCKIDFGNESSCPTVLTYANLCIDGVVLTSLYIPDGVNKIGAFAFCGNNDIEAVFIPQSVKSIGQRAFSGAVNIKNVYCVSTAKDWETMTSKKPIYLRDKAKVWLINPKETVLDGLEYTEENGGIIITGYEGNLFKLEIPEKIDGKPVVRIDSYAFEEKNTIAEVILPSTVKEIYPGAFFGCKYLTKVNIPKNVQVLHEGVFEKCDSLRNIKFSNNLKEIGFYAFSGCNSITKVEIPEGTESLLEHAFGDCRNLREIKIPDTLKVFSGTAFYNTAFYNDESNWVNGALYIGNYFCRVNENAKGKIVVKDGTQIIPAQAFEGNLGITEIVLPDSVTTIRESAFSGCENLKSVNLPEGITEIYQSTFSGCSSLEQIELPSGLKKIGESAFNGCKSLGKIDIPEGVTEIAEGAFALCGIESITLPEGVTRIEHNTFRYCKKLSEVNLGPNVKYISSLAFTDTEMYPEYDWDREYFYIDYCLLSYENILAKEYTVNDGTRVIGYDAFRNAYNLEVLNIPESVESICDSAFSGPTDLKTINFGGSELQFNSMIQGADTKLSKNTVVNFAKESEYIVGDANLDGKVNIRDATAIQKHTAKIDILEGKALELADFNLDNNVNIKDATAVQKKTAGLI